MTAPRLLDLFCCQGGAAMGYHRAGFDVTGVDIEPQPRYPFAFVQADALAYLAEHGHEYDAIHASPPCQDYSAMRGATGARHARLIAATFAALDLVGVPYIVENVAGAVREMPNAVMLCGTHFGLRVRRHRLFVTSPAIAMLLPVCSCLNGVVEGRLIGHRLGGKPAPGRRRPPLRTGSELRTAIECEWMTTMGVRQAVPPAYTESIGGFMLAHLTRKVA